LAEGDFIGDMGTVILQELKDIRDGLVEILKRDCIAEGHQVPVISADNIVVFAV
jgi:hypothetical protein